MHMVAVLAGCGKALVGATGKHGNGNGNGKEHLEVKFYEQAAYPE